MCAVLMTQGGGLQLQLDLWSEHPDKLAVINLCAAAQVTTELMLMFFSPIHYFPSSLGIKKAYWSLFSNIL